MMGGRTNHWGRISLRNGPYDFKPRTRDGLGFDWPMTYEDLEPYYDKVEMLIGVYGTNEGLENTPNSRRACCCRRPSRASASCSCRSARASSAFPSIAGPPRGADDSASTTSGCPNAAPRQRQGAADPRRRHAEARRLLLGHALRPRLLDPG